MVKENPYRLVEDIQGIGFKMADSLAEEIGIASDSPKRFRAALLHCLLEQSISQGDTYIEARDLLEYAITLLEDSRQIECNPESVAKELSQLIADGKVHNVATRIFDASLYKAEEGIKKHLTRLMDHPLDKSIAETDIDTQIKNIEKNIRFSTIRFKNKLSSRH